MVMRVCLLLALCACVCAIKPRKGFFCLDPDTGLLHGINTTWQSTTFCGNYTCKVRPINNTMETSESRNIVNETRLLHSVLKLAKNNSNTVQDETKPEKPHPISKDTDLFLNGQERGEAKTAVDRNTDIQTDDNNIQLSKDEGDRYLNGDEIRTISQLLHTVKKSDLEAIIEMYNLAQDIYKEMDEVENTNTNLPMTSQRDVPKYVKGKEDQTKKLHSYWYEPYILNEFYRLADLNPEGSEFVPTVTQKPPYSPPHPTTPCFNAAVLNNQEFGKLAYYYPISQFQRLASYYRQQQRPIASPPNRCNPCPQQSHSTTSVSNERKSNERTYNPSIPPQPILTPMLVPYPFSTLYNNGTGLAYNNYNNYYTSNPWANYEYYKKNPYNFFNMASVKPNINTNEEPKADVKEVTEKPKEETKSWLTDPLPEELIKEMRANIAERTKLLRVPLKNRIKVEKLGKIIKLDHLNRHTRVAREVEEDAGSGENKEDFEVYIERTTCNADTELGYFRVGNMSQPFPACCPQKIDGR